MTRIYQYCDGTDSTAIVQREMHTSFPASLVMRISQTCVGG
jgi:hypothetical protein